MNSLSSVAGTLIGDTGYAKEMLLGGLLSMGSNSIIVAASRMALIGILVALLRAAFYRIRTWIDESE